MNRPRTVNLVLRILMVSALLGGCATSASAPPTPITSFSQIEGKWRGTITLGFAGPQEFYEVAIHPDGSFVAQRGPNWQWGKVVLSAGTTTFEITAPGTSKGTVQYTPGRASAPSCSTPHSATGCPGDSGRLTEAPVAAGRRAIHGRIVIGVKHGLEARLCVRLTAPIRGE